MRVHGVAQNPLHGVSMRYSFDEQHAADRHTTQYFEIGGNRGIYHEGWTAVTKHATPWIAMAELPAFADDVWELYAPGDWTQANDLAAPMPEKLAELQELFLAEARTYNVLPLDDRRVERFDATIAGRPQLISGRSQILYGGMGRLTEATVINIKNVSHAVAADVEIPDGGASGVIVSQGGAFGGWSLYLRDDGVPAYCYNLMGLRSRRSSVPALAPGRRRVVMVFDYDGGGPAAAARSPSWSTGTRSPRAGSSAPCRWSSRSTRRATSGATAACRSATTTAPRTASSPARSTRC